ncbi:MAG: D-alanyl-D-alanine carboxypeptidase/D-alanyl-D-alanine-endopeptidase [Alphaproteobacteria bacterium]
MFKTFFYICCLLFLDGCTSAHQKLADQKPAFYAYIVGGVDSENASQEHNADVYITPASCQKTVTAVLAYKALGGDYVYETKLFITKAGDAVVTFSGDPTLRSEDLLEMLAALPRKHFSGKIIVDGSAFQTPPYSRNIIIDDMATSYARPVAAANIDENLITVTVTPGMFTKGASIENDGGYQMDNQTVTGERSAIKLSWNKECIKVSGTIGITDQPLKLKMSPENLDGYIANKFKNILKRMKLPAKVVIVKESHSADAQVVATHQSAPLNAIISPALKISDNFVFDALYLKIITKESAAPILKWEEGDAVFKALIKTHFNVDMDKALFVDGSGLSRYNRVQPRQLFKLLQKAYVVKEFVAALACTGEANTTLKNRTTLPVGIRAKTGTMSGINCLCGYNISGDVPQVFVIGAHNFAPPLSDIYPILDGFIADCFE